MRFVVCVCGVGQTGAGAEREEEEEVVVIGHAERQVKERGNVWGMGSSNMQR